jgi:hypothetical protein
MSVLPEPTVLTARLRDVRIEHAIAAHLVRMQWPEARQRERGHSEAGDGAVVEPSEARSARARMWASWGLQAAWRPHVDD